MNTTFDSVVSNMVEQCAVGAALGDLVPILQAYRIANAVSLAFTMPTSSKNELLGIVTGMTVATGTDLNCYPRGLETSLYFDVNGNPIT